MTDELHAPWTAEPNVADYRSAMQHAIALIEEGQTIRARHFLAGFLRGAPATRPTLRPSTDATETSVLMVIDPEAADDGMVHLEWKTEGPEP